MTWRPVDGETQSERLEDGARTERTCDACGEDAIFYERRLPSDGYLPADVAAWRLMRCGACGTHFVTDELGAPESAAPPATVEPPWADAGKELGKAVDRASEAAKPVLDQATVAVESAAGAVRPVLNEAAARLDEAAEQVGPALEEAGRQVVPALEEAGRAARGAIEEAATNLAPMAERAAKGIGSFLGRVTQELEGGAKRLQEAAEKRIAEERAALAEEDDEKAKLLERFQKLEEQQKDESDDE